MYNVVDLFSLYFQSLSLFLKCSSYNQKPNPRIEFHRSGHYTEWYDAIKWHMTNTNLIHLHLLYMNNIFMLDFKKKREKKGTTAPNWNFINWFFFF